MRILLTAATVDEILPLIKQLGINHIKEGERRSALCEQACFDVLISGMGMTAAAFWLGRYLDTSYRMAIQLGIAGSFTPELKIAEIVHVASDCFAEMGMDTEQGFVPLSKVNLACPPPASGSLHITNRDYPPLHVLSSVKTVHGITANTIHCRKQTINQLVDLFHPEVETMEGAAFLYACNQLGVPCLQIRSVSNYVKPGQAQEWDFFRSVKSLNNFAMQLIHELNG